MHYYKEIEVDRTNMAAYIGALAGAVGAMLYVKALDIEVDVERLAVPPLVLMRPGDESDHDFKSERSLLGSATPNQIWVDASLAASDAFHVGAHEAAHTFFDFRKDSEPFAVEVSSKVCTANGYYKWCDLGPHTHPSRLKHLDVRIDEGWRALVVQAQCVTNGDPEGAREAQKRVERFQAMSASTAPDLVREYPRVKAWGSSTQLPPPDGMERKYVGAIATSVR